MDVMRERVLMEGVAHIIRILTMSKNEGAYVITNRIPFQESSNEKNFNHGANLNSLFYTHF